MSGALRFPRVIEARAALFLSDREHRKKYSVPAVGNARKEPDSNKIGIAERKMHLPGVIEPCGRTVRKGSANEGKEYFS